MFRISAKESERELPVVNWNRRLSGEMNMSVLIFEYLCLLYTE